MNIRTFKLTPEYASGRRVWLFIRARPTWLHVELYRWGLAVNQPPDSYHPWRAPWQRRGKA